MWCMLRVVYLVHMVHSACGSPIACGSHKTIGAYGSFYTSGKARSDIFLVPPKYRSGISVPNLL